MKKLQNIFLQKINIQKKKKTRYDKTILLKKICFNLKQNNIKNIFKKKKKNSFKNSLFKRINVSYNK